MSSREHHQDYYQDLDGPWFDYELHAIANLPGARFRGPAIDPARPYVACVGGAQTYGRFCDRPFPSLLREYLGIQVLNLGLGGAGPRKFDTPEYLKWLNGAELVIVQVLSARSGGNSFFDNSARGGLLGVRQSDGKKMRFDDFFREIVRTRDLPLIRRIITETRDNYVRSTTSFLDHIRVPKLLFWFSVRSPDYHNNVFPPYFNRPIIETTETILNVPEPWQFMGPYPHLVDRCIVEKLRTHSDAYVECVSRAGIPQTLWKAHQPIDGAQLLDGVLVNHYYPSPEMHAKVAELLAPVCSRYLAGYSDGGRCS